MSGRQRAPSGQTNLNRPSTSTGAAGGNSVAGNNGSDRPGTSRMLSARNSSTNNLNNSLPSLNSSSMQQRPTTTSGTTLFNTNGNTSGNNSNNGIAQAQTTTSTMKMKYPSRDDFKDPPPPTSNDYLESIHNRQSRNFSAAATGMDASSASFSPIGSNGKGGPFNNFTTRQPDDDLMKYTVPIKSMTSPLRTAMLDPFTNTIPRSKTRSEFIHKTKNCRQPHISYDLDNDGYVSQDDYKISKRFDTNGNGILEEDERKAGQRVLAEEFFAQNIDDMEFLGPEFAKNTVDQNVDLIVGLKSFDMAFTRLKRMEAKKATSSKKIHDCMRLPKDNPLTPHNFFADKFDATAWNDFDAIPRSASLYGLTDHGGSRKRLMFSRQQVMRGNCMERLEEARRNEPVVNTRRLNLITNIKMENS